MRKILKSRKHVCLSVSARNDADAVTVLRFRAWCRRVEEVSVQQGLLMVVEGWLTCIGHR
jgi:hypothetical protein